MTEESPNPVHRRIDVRLIPVDQYYFGTLYFTGMRHSGGILAIYQSMPLLDSGAPVFSFFLPGSDMFNKGMRQHALEKGFTLNEYSVRPVGATGTNEESTGQVDILLHRLAFLVVTQCCPEREGKNKL